MIELNQNITYQTAKRIIFDNQKLSISKQALKAIRTSFNFLKKFEKYKIIYGINTGFGPMAQWRIDNKDLKQLQYNIIRSHSSGVGAPLNPLYVRAALLARLYTFMQGYSGVHEDLVLLIAEFINKEIYPMVPEHGSVGASGDLVQLAHIALALIGEGEVFRKDKKGNFVLSKTSEVLKEYNLKPFDIHIREGLSVTNGTSMMTGIAFVNLTLAKKLLDWSIASSLMMNEITSSFDDFMSERLNGAKLHYGQIKIAKIMRSLAKDSSLLQKREDEFSHSNSDKVFQKKVQSYYSLRCVPQILGPILEVIDETQKIVMEEFNSAADNPIIDYKTKNIYHGGNFHGDYISFQMDKLKIAITKLTILSERQLNYLMHDRINGILPPFVNLGKLGLNYGMQACQFTATSTTAECQTLSMPMYIHSIPNNNDNQDVVSMGTNSAEIAAKVIENSYQVMAIHLIAICQAIDYLKITDKLSSYSNKIYQSIRKIVPKFILDTPKYEDIRNVISYLKNK